LPPFFLATRIDCPPHLRSFPTRRSSDLALVLEIIQGRTTVAEASRQFDLTPLEVESWVEDGKRGMENALRAKPEDVREQYERQLDRKSTRLNSSHVKISYAVFCLKKKTT